MFVIIKPDCTSQAAEIVRVLVEKLKVRSLRQVYRTLTLTEARVLYAEHADKEFYVSLCEFMASGVSVLVTFDSNDFVPRWVIDDIRAAFGTSIQRNAIHAPRQIVDEERERAIFDI